MNLARNLSWYTATALLNSAVPFMLLPVFTHYLDPSDYGLMSAIIAYVAVLSPFIVLGLPALFSTDFHRLERSELCRKSMAWLALALALGGILIIAVWMLRDSLAGPLAMPSDWVPVVPLLALLGLIPQWASVMFQMDNRPRHFAAYQTAQAMFLIGTAIYFVVYLDMQWEGRLWSMLIVGGLASIVGFLALRPFLSFSMPRKDDVREAVKFGTGLLPHSVLSQIIRQSDRLFILHFIGLSAAGEYAVGLQIASIMLVLLSTFNQAWTPYLFQRLAKNDHEVRLSIVKTSYLIGVGFCVLFFVINLVSPLIFSTFVAEKFHDAQRYVPYVTLGYLFLGFYLLITDYIFYSKKTYILSILTVANGAINLILSYFCVQKFGAMGVAYSFALSSFFVAIAAWILACKVYPMPWLYWVHRRAAS